MSDRHDVNKSIWESVKDYLRNIIHKEIIIEPTINDVIGTNSKIVLFTLFGLILACIIMYSVLITGKYNPDSVFSGVKTDDFGFQSLEQKMYRSILSDKNTTDLQKLELINDFNEKRITEFQDRFQQIEQIDTVFIAAITGAVALGGTLITQLWGRRRS